MDAERFDALVKTLSGSGSRRGIARLLAALPLAGGLVVLLDETGEAGRRKRRKAKHRHQTGNDKEHRKGKRKGKRKRKGCTPKSDATTCAGKCSTVVNNCGKPVDCGPCTCAMGCPQCQSCNVGTGLCDLVTNGTGCSGGVCCGGECEECCADTDCAGCEICAPDKTCAPLDCGHHGTCSGSAHTCSCAVGTCSGTCPDSQTCASGCCCKLNNVGCTVNEECCSGQCVPGPNGNACTFSGCGDPCAHGGNCVNCDMLGGRCIDGKCQPN